MLLSCRIGFCVIFGCLFTLDFGWTQRRVEVRTEKAELRQVAHRLGVSEQRVREGRDALERATDLVGSVAGERSVYSLGESWARLDHKRAAEKIRTVFDQLLSKARREPTPQQYALLSSDAGSLTLVLKRLGQEDAEQLMEKWPPPEDTAPAGPVRPQPSPMQRISHYRQLMKLAGEDPESALSLLNQVEQGAPDAGLRSSVMWSLAQQGHHEQARELFNDLLRSGPTWEAGERGGWEMAVHYAARFVPDRLPEALDLWIGRLGEMPNSGDPFPNLPEGVEFTEGEVQILNLLGGLQMMGGGTDQVLARMPDLAAKLENLGGLSGFRRVMNESQLARQEEKVQKRTELARDPEQLLREDEIQSEQEAAEQMRRLLAAAARSFESESYDEAHRTLDVALRLLDRIEQPQAALRAYWEVARTLMRFDGELRGTFVVKGWDLLDALDRESLEPKAREQWQSEVGQFPENIVSDFEVWLYAAWGWSDFKAAMAQIRKLDEPTQFAVCARLAEWMAGTHINLSRFFH